MSQPTEVHWTEKHIQCYQEYQRVLQKAAEGKALTKDEKGQLYEIIGYFNFEIEELREKQK